jgi:general secretion pathway protein A
MYKDYYALKENPFNVTADPAFYYASSRHAKAYSHIEYGIMNRKGIIAVIGEIGTGKTTLCRTLLKKIDPRVKTALILNPSFSATQLLKMIIRDLGVVSKARSKFDLVNALNDYLLTQTSAGNNVVLIVDEAQNLGVSQLEQLRLLSNLETEKEKLLQIILIGQPELLDKLRLSSLRQLNQRIAVRFHMLPLVAADVPAYIEHRLRTAATDVLKLPRFEKTAFDAIFQLTQGTPRMINLLCDRVLLSGYAAGTQHISAAMVREAAYEVFQQSEGVTL